MDTPSRIKSLTDDTSTLILNPRFIGPCLAGLFCLIVATVVGVAYLFTMATMLLALPVASYIIGTAILRGCGVTRERQVVTTQGERAAVTMQVQSTHSYPPRGLVVRDNLPPSVEAEVAAGVELPHESEADVQIWFTPKKRGRYRIGPAEIRASDPLGMFRLRCRLQGTSELLVYPKPIRFRISRLSCGTREFESTDPSGRLAPHGDFAGVREYCQGDELRRVHWKTTARTQQLAVMELEDSTTGSVTVLLDLSRGSDFGPEHVTSLDVAAGAAVYALGEYLRMGKLVRLILPHGAATVSMELRGLKDLPTALGALADAQADASISIADILRSCVRYGNLLLITTKPDEHLVAAVRESSLRRIRISLAIVDPQPFGWHGKIGPTVAELERAGAEAALVREVGQQ